MNFIELQVLLRIYLLAAYLIIKEFILDKLRWQMYSEGIKDLTTDGTRWAVVTGANGTIGKEIVKSLVKLGYNVHAFVHKSQTMDECEEVIYYDVDLLKMEKISTTIASIDLTNVDLAVFSAGVMLADETHAEVEAHMAINVTSQLFIADLIRSRCPARFVFLSSATARAAEPVLTNEDSVLSTYFGPYSAYAFSKLALSVFVNEAVKRSDWDAITVHPGTVPGALYKNANVVVRWANDYILPRILRSPETSSKIVLLTAFSEDFRRGGYYEELHRMDYAFTVTERESELIYQAVTGEVERLRKKYM